jgi:RNA polymerase sigma-70 factor (ECF subfamily)
MTDPSAEMSWKPEVLDGGADPEDPKRRAPEGAEPSDADLARLVASGRDLDRDGLPAIPGRDAFSLLVQRHEADVLRLARRLCRNPEDARDVAQDAFLRAYRSLSSFQPERSFRSWLLKIAVNAARDHHARAQRSRLVPVEQLPEPADPAETAENRDRRLLAAQVERLLDELHPREREVFVLRDLEGLDVEDVAEALSLAPPTVRRHLARARLHLRRLFSALD